MESEALHIGILHIDQTARVTREGDTEIKLSRLEFDTLAYLAQNAGQFVYYSELWRNIWSASAPFGKTERETVRAVIKRLRKKLTYPSQSSECITCVHGVGVRLETKV